MNKIWVVVGVVSFFVLLLGAWFFVGNLGGFSQFLGEKSKEAFQDEQLKFVGTWTTTDSLSLAFFSTGSYRRGVEEGTWEIENNHISLSIGDATEPWVTYTYVFSENDTALQLTDIEMGEIFIFTKQ